MYFDILKMGPSVAIAKLNISLSNINNYVSPIQKTGCTGLERQPINAMCIVQSLTRRKTSIV